jgi:transposase
MLMLPPNTRIFVSVDRVDMRRSIDGLSVLVQDVLQQNPLSGHLFVFANKSGDKLKILYWDRNGFCLWYKRLEKNRFRLPKMLGKSYCVNVTELGMILEGIDLIEQRRLETLEYDKIN